MNNKNLAKVALRYRAIFLDVDRNNIDLQSVASAPVVAFVARLKENGYCVSEELLHALNTVSADQLAEITLCINSVMGTDLNWAPLVKGWNVPTGESVIDHIITLVANIFGEKAGVKGATLPCGHLIPNGTFPLERYNGCPFCGKQFQTTDFVYKGQGSKLKELRLFTLDDLLNVFRLLLSSPTPLDGTQRDNLGMLLHEFPLPENADIAMKETAMLVVKLLVAKTAPMMRSGCLKRQPMCCVIFGSRKQAMRKSLSRRHLWHTHADSTAICGNLFLAATTRPMR